MEVVSWKKKIGSSPGFMIRINQKEAIELIQSLSGQIATNNCNGHRKEFITDKGEYFSIAVAEKPLTPEDHEIDFIYHKINQDAKFA